MTRRGLRREEFPDFETCRFPLDHCRYGVFGSSYSYFAWHHSSLLIPAPPKQSARDMRPLWRDLILKVWGGDPLECPCCKGTMKPVRTFLRPEEIQFFLSLHGLWEGVITLPRPPPPPFDIETMQPIEPPWQAIKEWIPDDDPELNWFNQERQPASTELESFDQSPAWQPKEIPLGDGRTLVLDDS